MGIQGLVDQIAEIKKKSNISDFVFTNNLKLVPKTQSVADEIIGAEAFVEKIREILEVTEINQTNDATLQLFAENIPTICILFNDTIANPLRYLASKKMRYRPLQYDTQKASLYFLSRVQKAKSPSLADLTALRDLKQEDACLMGCLKWLGQTPNKSAESFENYRAPLQNIINTRIKVITQQSFDTKEALDECLVFMRATYFVFRGYDNHLKVQLFNAISPKLVTTHLPEIRELFKGISLNLSESYRSDQIPLFEVLGIQYPVTSATASDVEKYPHLFIEELLAKETTEQSVKAIQAIVRSNNLDKFKEKVKEVVIINNEALLCLIKQAATSKNETLLNALRALVKTRVFQYLSTSIKEPFSIQPVHFRAAVKDIAEDKTLSDRVCAINLKNFPYITFECFNDFVSLFSRTDVFNFNFESPSRYADLEVKVEQHPLLFLNKGVLKKASDFDWTQKISEELFIFLSKWIHYIYSCNRTFSLLGNAFERDISDYIEDLMLARKYQFKRLASKLDKGFTSISRKGLKIETLTKLDKNKLAQIKGTLLYAKIQSVIKASEELTKIEETQSFAMSIEERDLLVIQINAFAQESIYLENQAIRLIKRLSEAKVL
jgi:hypothetical protein